ncbi:MAG: hypothetical protein GVX78_02470, partial [Bacteroidetes bacterium]|nr:hypothetical protein [Bacteroidota bacterium]
MTFFKAVLCSVVCLLSYQLIGHIQYNTRDGLAQSQVRAISQDQNGYMWFGTLGGLSRFDGYEFTNYSTEDGLPSNQINALHSSKSGFWIGTTGSLCRKEGKDFISFPLPTEFSGSRIFDIAESDQGILWLALAGEGLLKYDGASFVHYSTQDGLAGNYIRSIAFDSDGTLWIGTRNGLNLYRRGRFTPPEFAELENISVSDIYFTDSGKAVICTFGNGVFTIYDGSITNYTLKDGIQSNHIRSAKELINDELWFASRDGLSRLKNGEFSVYREAQGLQYSNIKSLGADSEGNLWVGTDGQGVLLQAGRSFTGYSTEDGLHSDLVLGICKTNSDALLFSSYDNGLAFLKDEEFSLYPYNEMLPSQTVWAIDSDRKGTLWAGTSQGLYWENDGDIGILNSENGLPGDRVTALEIGDDGVWAGAEDGFAQLDFDGNIEQVFNYETGF